jgi:quercetin dioxygenase-like cupin family protein
VAHNRLAKVPPSISPAPYASTLWSRQRIRRVLAASVTFEPGARTAWHTHPLGQTLLVTAGCGLVQSWGRPIERIRPGDVIWCPPGEKHWHGATATTAMTHIAIVEQLDGKAVDWMEKVTDEQYQAGSSAEYEDKNANWHSGFGVDGGQARDALLARGT